MENVLVTEKYVKYNNNFTQRILILKIIQILKIRQ